MTKSEVNQRTKLKEDERDRGEKRGEGRERETRIVITGET